MIELSRVAIKFDKFFLQEITLSVAAGQYAVLMGRTGCGKTSLLETICGLRRATAGRICIGGVDVSQWSPSDRGIGYVPQDLALFPNLTVAEHLQFALRIRGWKQAAIDERTSELAAILGLENLLKRSTQGLSGGEAQRTALGRALSFRPKVLLLDEPLSALDDETRRDMFQLLHKVKQLTGASTLHVTHNELEADELADIKFKFCDGKIVVG